MADESRKLTIEDVVRFVTSGWDATELACFRQDVPGDVVVYVTSWALIETFIMQHVQAPEHWDAAGPDVRVATVLELVRRGAEAAEGQWEAELNSFLDETLGNLESENADRFDQAEGDGDDAPDGE